MLSIVFKKIALVVGILLIVVGAVLLIGSLGSNTFPVILGLVGIFMIGVFLLSKKKKWMTSNK